MPLRILQSSRSCKARRNLTESPFLRNAVRSMKGRFAYPNGKVVTPGGMTLICAPSYGSRL